jgi:hypothetical protein
MLLFILCSSLFQTDRSRSNESRHASSQGTEMAEEKIASSKTKMSHLEDEKDQ